MLPLIFSFTFLQFKYATILLCHWIRGSQVDTRPRLMDFSERKNPKYNFLQKGSKDVGPVS